MNPAATPCFCSTVSHAELDANGKVTLLSDIFPQTLQQNLCFWGVHGVRPALVYVMCVSQWLFGLHCSSSQTPVTLLPAALALWVMLSLRVTIITIKTLAGS